MDEDDEGNVLGILRRGNRHNATVLQKKIVNKYEMDNFFLDSEYNIMLDD